ncbi:MAG: hypothetical protein GX159_01335 [Flavobacteriaceae bacterium]|jgi:hypothetical protein|nr:hypothetical protein [Flavobacteriaceae bacterium]
MKISLFLIAVLFGTMVWSQLIQVDTLPVYHGCHRKDSNEKLKSCFRDKLIYELRDLYSLNRDEFQKEIKKNHKVIIYFTVSRDGTVKDFSYTEDSNPFIAVKVLKRLNEVFKHQNNKGNFIKPATYKGKLVNYKFTIDLSQDK